MAEWNDLTWVTQEVVSERKLDSMQGNADYVRDVARNRVLYVTSASQFWTAAGLNEFVSQVRLKLVITTETTWVSPPVTMEYRSSAQTWTRVAARNVAFENTGNGTDDLRLKVEYRLTSGSSWLAAPGSGELGNPIYTWSVDQEGYISFWADVVANVAQGYYDTLGTGSGFYVALRNLVIVFGMQNEGFSG